MKGLKVKQNKRSRYYRKKKKLCIKIVSGIGIVLVSGILVANVMELSKRKTYIKDTSCNQGPLKLPLTTMAVSGQNLLSMSTEELEIFLKEEAEKRKPKTYVGVSEAGEPYAYDATIIGEKLSHYDYTNNGEKIVFLTFDDGVSTTVTPQILEVLKEQDIKATFFLVGANIEKGGEKAHELVKQLFEEGHAIANHSYSHQYKTLYPNRNLNLANFKADFDKNEALIKEILGVNFTTRVLRCPGGYMSWNNMEELDPYLVDENKISIDWNALNKDAEGAKKNATQLIEEAKATAAGKEIVVLLMHDTYGKEETAKALPGIIEYFKANGYSFKTLV